MSRFPAIVVMLAIAVGLSEPARADAASDCFSADLVRRIAGCTELIERGDQGGEVRSRAYAIRALTHAINGHYDAAIRDYDAAIGMQPDFAVALNNRAWAYFRWGKAAAGLPDVEKSLQLNPKSPHTFDTRTHIRQALGNRPGALSDYYMAMRHGHYMAMRHGGAPIVRLYQCGLRGLALYNGEIDGAQRPALTNALQKCVRNKTCDPLPPGDKCPESP